MSKISGTYSYMVHDGVAVDTGKEAFEKLTSSKHTSVGIMKRSKAELREQVIEFRNLVLERNKEIEDVGKQYITTEPYYWDEVYKCLPAHCVEISLFKVADAEGTISFNGWDYSVLNYARE